MTKENSSEKRYRSLLRNIHPNEYSELTNPKFFGGRVIEKNLWIPSRKSELLRLMQEDDLRFYLPNDLMFKADMASMAVGLELRSPFLDYRVIEFGLSLPDKLKVGKGFGKKILREMAAKYVPDELMNRPKTGFAIPRAEWLRGPLRDAASDLLFGNQTRNRGWFDTEATKKIFDRHVSGDNRDRILWPAITLELWARNWLD
jgi:asparagine synthase (glutamine-hydrolysing)